MGKIKTITVSGLYFFIYLPVYFLTWLLFQSFLFTSTRHRRLRAAPAWEGPFDYWVHVASSGELEQAIPLMDRLQQQYPGCRVLLTYFSPSGQIGVLKETERRQGWHQKVPWSAHSFIPWDFPWLVSRFITKASPRAVFFVHQELWPTVLRELSKRNIPRFLVCAPSFLPKNKIKMSLRRILERQFTQVFFAYPEGQKNQDLRLERILIRKQRCLEKPALFAPSRPVFLLASLWQEDFEALREALLDISQHYLLWLVPHDPRSSVTSSIEDWFIRNRLPYTRWSQERTDKMNALIDQVGYLFELYRYASAVFVGGSFAKRVHNVLEPASFGLPLFTGPAIRNSHEALLLRQEGLLTVVNSAKELEGSLLEERITDKGKRTTILFEKAHLISEQIVRSVDQRLRPTKPR